MIIRKQKIGRLSEQDAFTIAGLLIKAGYTVSVRYDNANKTWLVNALGDGETAAT